MSTPKLCFDEAKERWPARNKTNDNVAWTLEWYYFGVMQTLLSGECECEHGRNETTMTVAYPTLLNRFKKEGEKELNKMLKPGSRIFFDLLQDEYRGIFKRGKDDTPCYPWAWKGNDFPLELHFHGDADFYGKIVVDHEKIAIPWPYYNLNNRSDRLSKKWKDIRDSTTDPSPQNPVKDGEGVHVHEVFQVAEKLIKCDSPEARKTKELLLDDTSSDSDRLKAFVVYSQATEWKLQIGIHVPRDLEVKAHNAPSNCTHIGAYKSNKLFLHLGTQYVDNTWLAAFEYVLARAEKKGWTGEKVKDLEDIIMSPTMEPYECGALDC